MTFAADKVANFLAVFNESKNAIRHFNGCSHLELLKQKDTENVYFTYSYWESEAHLNSYRNSPLFQSTWAKTKILFIEKAEAYSMKVQEKID